MALLLDELLDVSRITQGRLDPKMETEARVPTFSRPGGATTAPPSIKFKYKLALFNEVGLPPPT
jgi:hypothetical protein